VSARPRVGVIGLGIMGSAISARLMRAGYTVIGYDVLAARRRAHHRAGGEVAASCRDVASRAGVVICSLPSSDALRETAAALAGAPRPPRIVIETSTLAIAVKGAARRRLGARGATLLDCPISGTGVQARRGDLVVYTSGERSACRRIAPICGAFARAHYYVGPFGAASRLKFVANLLVAIHNVAAAEALVLAKRAGLDPAATLKAVAAGAGNSRMLEVRGPMMVKRDYSKPSMKLDVWRKDLKLIADFARSAGAATPLFSATVPLYAAAVAMGRGGDDTAAVHAVLERMTRRKED
jgi:3-hydroxyisobutyrate dehydrogenase-like beta-hydroxyacid dehydrogenase